MSDRQPGDLPEREEQVRRLLSAARHTEPMPDAVAQRLDLVLAQLVAEGPGGLEEIHPVVDLAARRRRRVAGLLVAAAAVVVAGVGIGAVTRDGTSSDDSPASSAEASTQELDRADAVAGGSDLGDPPPSVSSALPGAPGMAAESDPAAPETDGVGPQAGDAPGPQAPVVLTKKGFADEVAQIQVLPGLESTTGSRVPGGDLSRAEAFVCPPSDWGAGKLFAALYDGVPAVLAFRPPTNATQTVELLHCGTGDLLRSTVLPVP